MLQRILFAASLIALLAGSAYGTECSRELAYQAIDSERDYQDLHSQDWQHIGGPSVAEELLLMEHYLAEARSVWVSSSGDEASLEMMRKAAGIAVRCFENHGVAKR